MTDNWKLLTDEYYELIGRVYREDRSGEDFRFFGLVYGSDDLYYGMHGIDGAGMRLLSCVGNIEAFGFTLLDDFVETVCPYCGEETLQLTTHVDMYGPKEVYVEDIEGYDCSNCDNTYHTPQQERDRMDKIREAYDKEGL